MIRVGKYGYRDVPPSYPGYKPIMVRLRSDGGFHQLSSYYVQCQNPDEPGKTCNFECMWQGSKCYPKVTYQDQRAKWNSNIVIWSHPAEDHVDKNNNVLPAYLSWRKKLMNAPLAVRYPTGFNERHNVLCSLLPDKFENGVVTSYRVVGGLNSTKEERYIAARKEIYYPLYAEAIKKLPEFKQLKTLVQSGVKLLLIDVDGPTYTDKFPFNQTKDKSIEINEQNIRALIDDPSQCFSHAYVAAVCLLDKEEWLQGVIKVPNNINDIFPAKVIDIIKEYL